MAVIIPAVFALKMGSFFLWLLSLRKTPIGDLKVKARDKILPFKTIISEGSGLTPIYNYFGKMP